MVVLVTSLVSELHSAQHGTSAGEYNVVIDAKVEGDQWKEIMNQAQTNETIGQSASQGLETNVSKVNQKLIEAPRGSSQRAESCMIVTQSFDRRVHDQRDYEVVPAETLHRLWLREVVRLSLRSAVRCMALLDRSKEAV